jgi:PAS domain S-box-containing protein
VEAAQVNSDSKEADSFLSGGGEMGERIRAFDWSKTPLGPRSFWSPSLRMMVRFLLANRFPLLLWWGPQFIQIYNDPYRPVLGAKHPESGLGRPVSECWSEIWHILRPLIQTPFNGGPATWMEDIQLEINRYGFVEETHFTIAYSPVPDETVPSGIGGVLATVHEISEKVVGERRVRVLRDLGIGSLEAKTAEEACVVAADTLAKHSKDVPFALLYLIDPDGKRARLAGAAGVNTEGAASPLIIELGNRAGSDQVWPLSETLRTERLQTVDDLSSRFEEALPPGPWADPPQQAVVAPIRSNIAHQLAGLLVVGISTRLRLDDAYRSFIELAASQIATGIANARAYEEEKRRAEALAEIDRAKTAFFSNVSHEFRTPLTLMLGPLEDAISTALDPTQREELEVVHRNGLRLLKLVNTLLDFSRIEAGRVQAIYEPTDLATFTAELASVFRSAIERAKLQLVVDCPPLPEPIYVDREMWEKIVLNLLSNAFKFTFEGIIGVSLHVADDDVELRVSDTGTGIPESELGHLFERFHRIRGVQSRTHEGSGIGLALVRELARLHGGSVSVESEVGRGTTFVVRVPTGSAHLPPDRIGAERTLPSTTVDADTYLQEAQRWLPETGNEIESSEGVTPLAATVPARILVAEDNADMREYVRRILGRHWTVETVSNGIAALAAARKRLPEIVLSDVMMPGLDGLQLLRALRSDPLTRRVPVILLSARAGEESRVEGLESGADDYMSKPFSARELVARVGAHLKIARIRAEAETELRESEARFRILADSAPALIWVNGTDGCEFVNREYLEFLGVNIAEVRGYDWAQFIHPEDRDGYVDAYESASEQRQLFEAEFRFRRNDGAYRSMRSVGRPRIGPAGEYLGYAGMTMDITERKQLSEQVELERARLRYLVDKAPAFVALMRGPGHVFELANAAYLELVGREVIGKKARDAFPEVEGQGFFELLDEVFRTGESFVGREMPIALRRAPGEPLQEMVLDFVYQAVFENDGSVSGIFLHGVNVSDKVRARRAIEEANRLKDEFLATLSHELRNPLNSILGYAEVLRRSAEAKQSELIRKAAYAIHSNADAQAQLINDLLDLSRLQTGKLAVELQPSLLAPLIGDAVETVRGQAGQKGIKLNVDLPAEPLTVNADPVRVQQIVWNLVNNAVKFTTKGGLVSVSLNRDGEDAILVVEDTGQGIDTEFLPHVFEMFRQADAGVTRRHGGLGVGLALVRQLTELHGGKVTVHSDGPGFGTRFTVRFPLHYKSVDRGSGVPLKTTGQLIGARILVVDDNPDSLDTLRILLSGEGAMVETASSGALGLNSAADSDFDLVISDISMPEMDGYEFLRAFRANPRYRDTPAIALTGFGREEDVKHARQAGFTAHLTKPIDFDNLIALACVAIETYRRN